MKYLATIILAFAATVGGAIAGVDGPRDFVTSPAPNASFMQVAQDAATCNQLRQLYEECDRNWRNLGGGDDGQAGAFKQCRELYAAAYSASGC
jgi:hypothetical protein